MTAITISLDQVSGVAGLIEPGDYVNIMARDIKQAATVDGNPVPQSDVEMLFDESARYLYQKVEVLAVDTTFVPQAGQTATGTATEEAAPAQRGLITLILPVRAAQYVASIEPERLYLTLVARDYEVKAQSPIDPADAIPGEDPSQITPYGPEGPDNAS